MTTYTINAFDPDMGKSGNFMANLKSWDDVQKQISRAISYGLQNITIKVVQH